MNEEIVDAEFEEIPEREVILTSELSEADAKKIEESDAAVSSEDAAAFAAEMEAAQKDLELVHEPEHKLTNSERLRAVKNAVAEGVLSPARKTKMMQELGIYKSTFTKKQPAKSAKSKSRKQAKNARRKNRK